MNQKHKTLRSFYCEDALWEMFEVMTRDLDCSMDYLINEAMRQYGQAHNYSAPSHGPGYGAPNHGLPPEAPSFGNHPTLGRAPGPTGPAPAPGPGTRPRLGPPTGAHPAPPTSPLSYAPPQPSPGAFGYASAPAAPMAPPAPQFAPPQAPQFAPPQAPMAPQAPSFGPPGAPRVPPPPPRPTGQQAPVGYAPPQGPAPQGPAPQAHAPQAPAPSWQPAAQPSAAPAPAPQPGQRPVLYLFFNGQRFAINKDRFVVGRGSQGTDLTIRDGNISRKHAAVIFHDGGYYIQDLGSTNGIDYRGGKVDSKQVEEGDLYSICDYELRFSYRA
jgi:hypothetical protein